MSIVEDDYVPHYVPLDELEVGQRIELVSGEVLTIESIIVRTEKHVSIHGRSIDNHLFTRHLDVIEPGYRLIDCNSAFWWTPYKPKSYDHDRIIHQHAIDLIIADVCYDRLDELETCGKDDDCKRLTWWIERELKGLARRHAEIGGNPEDLSWTRQNEPGAVRRVSVPVDLLRRLQGWVLEPPEIPADPMQPQADAAAERSEQWLQDVAAVDKLLHPDTRWPR